MSGEGPLGLFASMSGGTYRSHAGIVREVAATSCGHLPSPFRNFTSDDTVTWIC